MLRSMREMAGILVLLGAVVALAAFVVNSSVSAKDNLKEGARRIAKKAGDALDSDVLREKIKTEPAPAAPAEPAPRAIDPAAKALKSGPEKAAPAGKGKGPEMDDIDRMLEEMLESGEAKEQKREKVEAKKEAPAKASDLTRPAEIAPPKASPAKPPMPGRRSAPPARSNGYYVVRRGDTLYRIAVDYYGDGKMWKAIARANGIKDPSKIPVGARLSLPARAVQPGK